MPSNEAIELIESVLNENSRLKYLKTQYDKNKDAGNRMNQSSKDIDRISDEIDNLKPRLRNIKKARELNKELDQAFENNKKASEDWNDTAAKINKYSTGSEGDTTTVGNFNMTKSDIQGSGKRLKDEMEMNKKYHSFGYKSKLGNYANDIGKSYAGKQAYMKDFGGPESGYNTIDSNITTYGNGRSDDAKYSKYGKDSVLDVEFNKKKLKERIEKAKKNPHVVGGYKLEAAQILIEALDTLLSE